MPRISLTSNENDSPLQFNRKQFPIKLSFALAINKSQGQTIKKVGLFLEKPLFHHGQLYTAMSRVTNKDSFKIMIKQTNYNGEYAFYVNNVVYKEVFNNFLK